MVHAIALDEAGGPEVLTWREVEVGEPGPGEIRLRHLAVGLNFIDVYYRKGVYPPPGGYPLIPGAEAAGEVEAVGAGRDGPQAGRPRRLPGACRAPMPRSGCSRPTAR